MKRLGMILTVAVMTLASAQADMYEFYAITSYTNAGYQSVVSQMSMDVVPLNDTSAALVFTNAGPVESTVDAIYFDYAPEIGVGLDAVDPADWAYGTPPPDLPGGGGGLFTADFYLMVDSPPTKKGITIGSSLEVVLSYNTGFDILAALNSGDLRVGLHTIGIVDTDGRVVGIGDDPEEGAVGDPWSYSESSISIPEPASLVLLVGTSSLIVFIRRRLIV